MNHVQYSSVNLNRTTGIMLPEDAIVIYMCIDSGFANIYYMSPLQKPAEKLRIFLIVESYISIHMENHTYMASHYDSQSKRCYHLFEEINK